MYAHFTYVCVYLYNMCVPKILQRKEKGSDPLGLELDVASHDLSIECFLWLLPELQVFLSTEKFPFIKIYFCLCMYVCVCVCVCVCARACMEGHRYVYMRLKTDSRRIFLFLLLSEENSFSSSQSDRTACSWTSYLRQRILRYRM